jgi:hypothetical protein
MLGRVNDNFIRGKAINITYLLVCGRSCVHVPGRFGVCMRVRAGNLDDSARIWYVPRCDVICVPAGSDITSQTARFSKK